MPPFRELLRRWPQAGADASPAEADFCARRLAKRDEAVARTCITLAIPYHAISILTDRLIVAPEDISLFLGMHLTLLFCHGAWLLHLRDIGVRASRFLWPLQIVYVAFLAYVLRLTLMRGADADVVLAATGLTLTSGIMVALCPFHRRGVVVTAAIYAALGVAATWGTPLATRWAVVDVLALAVVTVAQYISVSKTRALALSEYRTMRLIAPEQIVRGAASAGDGATLESLFRATMRPVACVSSDWRDFQAYSRTAEPADVARTLDAYYELCARVLREIAPEGNYYTDWIADELFIVFYGRPSGSSRALVLQAAAFAKRLVAERPAFMREYSMPQAVDVGISTGLAYCGLMGSSGYRKATALGEVPGKSRRLQAAGKLLRARLGHEDRIIIDDQAADWLRATESLCSYQLLDGETLRDLDNREIRYVPASAA